MSTISASTTSTTAFKITTDTTGALVFQTGASPTTAMTLGSDQSVTFAGAVTLSGNQTVTGNLTVNGNTTIGDASTDTATVNATTTFAQAANLPNTFGFKNRIINGGMVIDQRNNGAVVSSAIADDAFYTLDRWYARQNVASKFSIQRSTVAPAGFSNSILLTSLSAYSLGASDHFGFTQPIEGFNTADLSWGTANGVSVTLSFWVRSSLTGTFGGHVNNADSTMTYVFSYTISAANTWEYKTITVPAPSTSTWQTGNLVGVYVTFSIGAGSSVTRATGWGAFARSVTGQTSVVGTNGATFYITGVQLEKGSTATSFDFRSYGQELTLCQRYYFQHSGAWNSVNFYYYPVMGRLSSTTSAAVVLQFPVTMRAAPTFTQVGGANMWVNPGSGNTKGVTLVTDVASTQSINLTGTFTAIAGSAAGNGFAMYQDGASTTALQFSAEL